MDESFDRLAVFQTDEGITLAFGERTYFIGVDEPFYVEMAKREGLGEELRDALLREVARVRLDPDLD